MIRSICFIVLASVICVLQADDKAYKREADNYFIICPIIDNETYSEECRNWMINPGECLSYNPEWTYTDFVTIDAECVKIWSHEHCGGKFKLITNKYITRYISNDFASISLCN
ncbi:hypothetical protein PGB90_008694 [Kerria lacca]